MARGDQPFDTTHRTLEADITRLIADMETSIREAENFIRDLKSGP